MSDINNMNWRQRLANSILGVNVANTSLTPSTEDVAAFSEAIKGANTEIAALKAQITGLQNQTETEQKTVASLTADNKNLKTENESLKAQNDSLKAENQKFADASKSKASFAVLETDTKQKTNRSYVDANAPHNVELQAYLAKLK